MHEAINRQRYFAFRGGRAPTAGARNLCDEFVGAVLQHLAGAIKNLAAIVGGGFAPTGHSRAGSDDGTDLLFGAGVQYDLTNKLGIRGQWTRYDVADEDADLFSIGLIYRF